MSKFRKLPVEIEAYHFTGDNLEVTPLWFLEAVRRGTIRIYTSGLTPSMVIETLEGPMTASFHDWIIQGVNGELYACKPDIFAKTYEPVRDAKRPSSVSGPAPP